MSPEEIVTGAFDAFRTDIGSPPPLTLRGGNAVDSYSHAPPFDPAEDEPTDAYFEESRRVQTWGGYLCGDAHTIVAVNVTPLDMRSIADSIRMRCILFRNTVS